MVEINPGVIVRVKPNYSRTFATADPKKCHQVLDKYTIRTKDDGFLLTSSLDPLLLLLYKEEGVSGGQGLGNLSIMLKEDLLIDGSDNADFEVYLRKMEDL